MTIAVRDKVIEKFTGQPLDEMNNSLKALLSKEEDEQKRLGILAARVYILRQRILSIAEDDADRVLTTNSPRLKDLASESILILATWRLRQANGLASVFLKIVRLMESDSQNCDH